MKETDTSLQMCDLLRASGQAADHLVHLTQQLEEQYIDAATGPLDGAQLRAMQSIDLLQQSIAEMSVFLMRLSDASPTEVRVKTDQCVSQIKLQWLRDALIDNASPDWRNDGAKPPMQVALF